VAFTFEEVHVTVIDIGTQRVCSGNLCGGLYGSKPCACVSTSTLPRMVLSVSMIIEGSAIRLETFSSTRFSKLFVDEDVIEVHTLIVYN
jgi:hypothetical protein